MDLSVNVSIYTTCVELLSYDGNMAKVRTKEVVPFWGDYCVVEVELTPAQLLALVKHEAIEADLKWTTECIIEEILFLGCSAIGKQLSEYAREQLNCQAIALKQTPFGNPWNA